MGTKLGFPAYDTITNEIILRNPLQGNIFAVKGRARTMPMSDGAFRTYVKTIGGRSFDMTFNLYCLADYLATVEFFKAYNGHYLLYTDSNAREWILQVDNSEISIDDTDEPNVWSFSISGLNFGQTETGSEQPDYEGPWTL